MPQASPRRRQKMMFLEIPYDVMMTIGEADASVIILQRIKFVAFDEDLNNDHGHRCLTFAY